MPDPPSPSNDSVASSFAHTRDPAFWEAIYDDQVPPWDLGRPHPTLEAALSLGLLRGRRRLLVPGAGLGHDALRLAESGHRVTAVDFAAPAVASLRARAEERGLVLDVRRSDVFDLADEPAGSFDGVYEYTCYCAIDPALRPRYRDLMTHLVQPGGRLLMLAFPIGREDPGPPHDVDLDELAGLFSTGWRWLFDAEPYTTPAPRADLERLVLLERTAAN